MTTLTWLIVIWAIVLVAFVALLIYRGHLTEHETDQLYLGEEAPTSFHRDNDDVIRKVKIVQPICLGMGGLTLLMTLVIAGLWVAQKLT
jgi:hypothetical protein